MLIRLARDERSPDHQGGLLMRRRPTQQELANMVGATRESVSRCLTTLARKLRGLSRAQHASDCASFATRSVEREPAQRSFNRGCQITAIRACSARILTEHLAVFPTKYL